MPRLSETYDQRRPGLPRGRSSLPAEAARAAQRGRLLRAVVAAVAERGYAETTVADIVARARVSRREFYQHFADKRECFLAAALAGGAVIFGQMRPPDGPVEPEAALREGMRDYLQLCAREAEFTRCLIVELPACGPEGLRLRNEGFARMAEVLRAWHAGARTHRPHWPPVPEAVFAAAVGAITELVLAAVTSDRPEALPDLTDTAVDVLRRLFGIP
jgi:AcrR family transcriptional regulator